MRPEADDTPSTPATQGKAIGDWFSIARHSKTIAGQLREEAGPCKDHVFLIPKVRRPPWPHMHRRSSLEANGKSCQGMFYLDAFLVRSILTKRYTYKHGRILRYTTYGLWTRQIRITGQRKPRRITHKSNSAWVYIHTYCTLFLRVNTCSLLSVFVEMLSC